MNVLVVLIIFKNIQNIVTGALVDVNKIDDLVKQWAPLIWLSPEEKYMPLDVETFLEYTIITNEFGKKLGLKNGLVHQNSKTHYLLTKDNLENLKADNSSFIYGRNPKLHHVPVYTVITYCSPYISFHSTDRENILNDISIIYGKTEPNLYFHVSYWIFYPYNEGKDICLFGKVPTPMIFNTCFGKIKTMGNHVGDWEHMSLSFVGKAVPSRLYLAVHDAGVYYKFDEKRNIFRYESQITRKGVVQVPKFPPIVRTQNGHPVLFAAMGSHGLWSSPGIHDYIRVPKLSDRNGYGVPWKTWNTISTYHIGISRLPDWMLFKGRWGNPKTNCFLFKKLGICENSDGPLGILRKKVDFYC